MAKKIAFWTLVVAVPAFALVAFFAYGVSLVAVTNRGEAVELQVAVIGGSTVEHTETKAIDAGSFGMIYFVPKTEGRLALGCHSAQGRNVFLLAQASSDLFAAVDVKIDGCKQMLERHSFKL